MWIRASGEILENVYLLTTAVSSHFFISGEQLGLVDASAAAVESELLQELEAYVGEEEGLAYLFITHAHFDHVGGIPALRKRYPEMKVVASAETAEMLSDPDIQASIIEKNQKFAEALGRSLDFSAEQWREAFKVEKVVGDGDGVNLGYGVEVKVITTPGHTADCTSYLVLPDGAVQGGETFGGYHGRGICTPCFTSSYDDYMGSIGKLSSLEINALCLSHGGALRGELARKFLDDSRTIAEQFVSQVTERIAQGELIDEIADSVATDWKTQCLSPDGPFVDALQDSTRRMVELAVAKKD